MTLLSEEEAKGKWCHRAHDGSNQKCIGSQCMAWRQTVRSMDRRELPVGEKPEPDAKAKGWETPTTTIMGRVVWVRERPRQGYCGLAGKP